MDLRDTRSVIISNLKDIDIINYMLTSRQSMKEVNKVAEDLIKINIDDPELLEELSSDGQVIAVKKLLEIRPHDYNVIKALHYAKLNGHNETVKYINSYITPIIKICKHNFVPSGGLLTTFPENFHFYPFTSNKTVDDLIVGLAIYHRSDLHLSIDNTIDNPMVLTYFAPRKRLIEFLLSANIKPPNSLHIYQEDIDQFNMLKAYYDSIVRDPYSATQWGLVAMVGWISERDMYDIDRYGYGVYEGMIPISLYN